MTQFEKRSILPIVLLTAIFLAAVTIAKIVEIRYEEKHDTKQLEYVYDGPNPSTREIVLSNELAEARLQITELKMVVKEYESMMVRSKDIIKAKDSHIIDLKEQLYKHSIGQYD